VVDFRSGWALSWGVGATGVFYAKAQCNVAAATGCWSRRRYHRTWWF